MSEKDQENVDISLEEILKEFGHSNSETLSGDSPEQEEMIPHEQISRTEQSNELKEIQEESDTDILREPEGWENEKPSSEPAQKGDTIKLEFPWRREKNQKSVPEDTIRLDDISQEIEDTRAIDTEELNRCLEEMDESPSAEQTECPEESQKPFESGWEPEYEAPMGEYVPPEPIQFRHKSRLKELKRKLVAGPEKRFYDLAELGLGKLQITFVLNLIVVALSVTGLVMYSLGAVSEARLPLLVYSQVLAMLISALLGSFRLMDGIGDLLHKRFTLNTLLAVMFAACLADGILGLKDLKIPFCAAFSLEMTMAIWAEIHRRNTEMGQMDTLRKAVRLDSVVKVPAFYQERPGFLRGQGEVEDFMDTYQQTPNPEKTLSVYGLIAMVISLCIGVAGGIVNHSVSFGIHGAAAALLASVPATAFIAMTRPGDVLEKRLHRLGAVICGWDGVRGLSGPAVIPLSDDDIFPHGSVKMNGMKFFGARDADQIIAYGAALIAAEGGGLTPVFEELLDSRNGFHYDVDNLRSYDSGGLGGEINGEPVLVGVLPFLQEMGVDMPEGTRVNQAVYVAIDGELCGVFAITYNRMRSSAAGMTTLCSYRSLTPVLTSRDFMLTESFLRSKFGINTRRMEFPDRAMRCQLCEIQPDEQAPALALTTQEGLAASAFAITGARALRTALRLGTILHMIAGILGLLIVCVLAVTGYADLLSPINLLLYEAAWMIPGFLITEWARTV